MQETTFNQETQEDGSIRFPDTHSWLNAFYSEASLKKFDQSELHHIISHKISFAQLEKKINYTFKDKKYLILALTQSTFCYEMKESTLHSNERLEFLGDSLINFIVGKNLYHLYKDHHEGDLSKLRGALVNEEKLAELARSLTLGEFLFMGRGELRSRGFDKDSILADAFEALFAAIYFDSNNNVEILEQTLKFIVDQFEKNTKTSFYSLEQLNVFDTKSKLQELTMAAHGVFPTYKSSELPDHTGFHVEVWLGDKKLAAMTGPSKKKVEKQLAKKIIDEKLY
nr:ribonuclease III [Bacteriovorax sp. HI3]